MGILGGSPNVCPTPIFQERKFGLRGHMTLKVTQSGTERDQYPYSQSSVHTPGGDSGGRADHQKPGFDLVLELSSTPLSGTRGKEKTLL